MSTVAWLKPALGTPSKLVGEHRFHTRTSTPLSSATTALRDQKTARAWRGDEALISYPDGAARAKCEAERVDP